MAKKRKKQYGRRSTVLGKRQSTVLGPRQSTALEGIYGTHPRKRRHLK